MKDNLEILITKCVENDRVGQQKIYQLFAPVLYGLCLKYMKNEDDAKDVFQEAFVIAYQKMYQLIGKYSQLQKLYGPFNNNNQMYANMFDCPTWEERKGLGKFASDEQILKNLEKFNKES